MIGDEMDDSKQARDEIQRIVEMAGPRPDIWVEVVESKNVQIRNSMKPFFV